MDDIFRMMFFGGHRRRRYGKAKKKPKAKKDNWFERLTVDEVKQICKAAKLPVKGTKKDIIQRLLENESTRKFAWEGMAIGCTVGALKGMCRERGLVQSGTKLTLVLRITEHDHGTATPSPESASKKRAAASSVASLDDGTPSVPPAKKRKKAPARPSPDKIYQKVQKKIESVKQKKFQSHYGSKCHAPEVYSAINTILGQDIIDKGYLVSDPRFALDLAKSALTSLDDNFGTMQRPGYDDFGSIRDFSAKLGRIVAAAEPALNSDEKAETLGWIDGLDSTFAPYGLGEDHYGSSGERYLQTVAKMLRPDEVPEGASAAKEAFDEEEKTTSPCKLINKAGKQEESISASV